MFAVYWCLMYLAIDIGGTKTLLAVFDAGGQLIDTFKLPTNPSYEAFKAELAAAFKQRLGKHPFKYACVAVPGRIDRHKGIALGFGNLGWQKPAIRADISSIVGVPVIIENDANLAGLSEARLVIDTYKRVLYLTISTGIGDGIIINGVIDPDFADSEAGHMVLEHDGQMTAWEDFASGRAIVRRFGKKAAEITDPATWRVIARDIAHGLIDVIATMQPEVVIIGGGVGAHFDKFGALLINELKRYENTLISIPPVIGAKRPEEAVIYGCYELIRQQLAKPA